MNSLDRPKSDKQTFGNLALTLLSLVFAFGLLIVAEYLVRLTTNVGRLGTSADLFINDAFGESIGNSPNTETVAFGIDVRMDEQGFRTGADNITHDVEENTMLILGDSVGFGVGVEFDLTVAARLASSFPEFRMINTAVIGYGVNDYHNVSRIVVPRYADTMKQAFLIFCLNDVSVVSAAKMRSAIAVSVATGSPTLSAGVDFQSLKEVKIINDANSFLRSRSSLYVWIRGVLTDPQTRYWQNELENYQQLSDEKLQEILRPLERVAKLLEVHDVPFTIFVLPFAGQMDVAASALPQRMLTEVFQRQGIKYVDLLPAFRANERPQDLFLPYDPMHLSPEGHKNLFQAIRDHINQSTITVK